MARLDEMVGGYALTNRGEGKRASSAGYSNEQWLFETFGSADAPVLVRTLLRVFDALPFLPADPALYPPQGGLFKNGATTGGREGYSLARIYGAVPGVYASGNPFVDALMRVMDGAPPLPTDPAAYSSLAPGLYRDGDANGYRIVRML